MQVLPPISQMHLAVERKSSLYDGVFYLGVKTTGIFCRPSCSARLALPQHRRYFVSTDEALTAGYRPCKRCHPLLADLTPDYVKQAISLTMGEKLMFRDTDLKSLGIDPVQIRRYFLRNYGVTFQKFVRLQRMEAALDEVRSGVDADTAMYNMGYESLSGFRDTFKNVFGFNPGKIKDVKVINFEWINTPLGSLLAGSTNEGICWLEFADLRSKNRELQSLRMYSQGILIPGANQHIGLLKNELSKYFNRELKAFSVPVTHKGTQFQTKVWDALQRIPYGKTISYAQLAREVNNPKAVRAVAQANGQNKIVILIPCHRVINTGGKLGGYSGGMWRKKILLKTEGII